MNRIFFLITISLLFISCSKEEIGIPVPEFIPKLINVSFHADLNDEPWLSYHPDEKNEKFYPKWNTGDLVTVVADLDKDIIAPFTVESHGTSASMRGDITTWGDKADLNAIYPHREDAYGHKEGKFTVNISSQYINAKVPSESSHSTTDNAMNNAILLAKAPDVTIDEYTGIVIDKLFFRQAMSFIRFTLKKSDHTIVKITLKDKEAKLVTEAQISSTDTDIIYENKKYANEVYGVVEGQDLEKETTINFALFPTTLTDPTLVIETKDKNSNSYTFTRLLPLGLELKRNMFNYFSDTLDLDSDDFTLEKKSEAMDLDSFGHNGKAPEGNNWVIKSMPNITDPTELQFLKQTIANCQRKITLVFSDVTSLECNSTFWEWPNLERIELPNCKEIWTNTFGNCPDLKTVIMPALEKAGSHTFHTGNNLPTVEFIAATNPGVKLEYTYGGNIWVAEPEYKPAGFLIHRVNITLGNKYLYKSYEYGNNCFKYYIDNQERAVYFGSMTWQ